MDKLTFGSDQELLAFMRDRDLALNTLDIEWGKKFLARPNANDHTILIALHKARLQSQGVPSSVKKESRHWLTQHGYQEGFQ